MPGVRMGAFYVANRAGQRLQAKMVDDGSFQSYCVIAWAVAVTVTTVESGSPVNDDSDLRSQQSFVIQVCKDRVFRNSCHNPSQRKRHQRSYLARAKHLCQSGNVFANLQLLLLVFVLQQLINSLDIPDTPERLGTLCQPLSNLAKLSLINSREA